MDYPLFNLDGLSKAVILEDIMHADLNVGLAELRYTGVTVTCCQNPAFVQNGTAAYMAVT